jgi:tRNA(Ile)-lysidine synthase
VPGLTVDEIAALFAPFASCEKLGLAVSGGPDSLALMLLAAQWARAPDRPRLHVYTVDHRLRPEAAAEAAMVAREAERLGLACRVLAWEGDKPATGIQAAARTARYRLLAGARSEDGADLVLTAHHLGDQAETVLMRLAHGSGIEGLAGMREVSFVEGCKIGRPLLGVRPEVLRAAVVAAGLTPAADPGNDDPTYERVRWRQFQPELDRMGLTLERLGTLARRMELATSLVADSVEDVYPKFVVPLSGTHYEIVHGRFAALNPLVGAALLGQVLELVSGDRRSPPLGALESLQAVLQRFEPMKRTTLHGCVVSAKGNVITVRKEGPRRNARSASSPHAPHRREPASTAN